MKSTSKGLVGLLLALTVILITGNAGFAASKDTLTVAMWTRISTMDSWNNAIAADWIVADQMFECLYVLDEKTLRPKPHLALSHKRIDDLTWEFELRKGVTFHNGEPFNAAVVKYSFDRVLDPNKKLYDKPKWDKIIDSVEVLGDYTVRIKTQKPFPIMLENLAYDAAMVPPKYIEEKGDAEFGEHPVGTGPYKFVSWKRAEEIVFVRNDDYWGEKAPIKNLVFRIIPEPAVSTAELITGGIDVIGKLGADQVKSVEKSKNAQVVQALSNRVHFIQFDSIGRAGETPFQKIEVRRAVYHAIDREAIIKNVKQGYGVMLHGPLYPTYFAYDPSVENIEPKYDPEKAKKLLAEAGYPNGFDAELSAYEQKEVYEAVQGYLRKIGINTKFNWYGADISTLIKLRNAGKVHDMGAYSWGANIFDPDYFLPYWYELNVAKNYMNDEDIHKWLMEAGTIFDEKERADLYRKVQYRIVEKAYWVPVFGEVAVFGVNKDLNFSTIGEYPKYFRCSWK